MTTIDTYIAKLKKYLPAFVVESDVREALLKAIAKQFFELYTAMEALDQAEWLGRGLLLNAEESKIFYNNKRLCVSSPGGEVFLLPDGITPLVIRNEDLAFEQLECVGLPSEDTVLLLPDGETYLSISESYTDEEPIRQKLLKRLEYLTQRGTEKGIKQDLDSLFGLSESTVVFKDFKETGIITGVTHFGDNNFVGVDKLIEFYTTDKGYIVRRDAENELIQKSLIPINTNIIFIGE
jgi:hypothetical protein